MGHAIKRLIPSIALLSVVLLSAVVAKPALAQIPNSPFSATSAEMEKIQPPREIRLALKHARIAQAENDVAKLSVALGTLMAGVARTDYLVDAPANSSPPPPATPTARTVTPSAIKRVPLLSMRGQVEELFENLTDSQRQAFQALHEAKASSALDSAIATKDIHLIERVAYGWRYTDSGQEAAMLVARLRLDQGRYSESLGMLHGLRRFSYARERFEPELSQLLISATWMRGEREAAAALVESIARDDAWVLDRFEGAWRQILAAGETGDRKRAIGRLTAELGSPATPLKGLQEAWPMFLGGPRRQAQVDLVETPQTQSWRMDLAKEKQLAKQIRTQHLTQVAAGAQALPVTYPTIVNRQLIVRTPERLVSLDLSSGKDLWSFPFDYENDVQPTQAGRVNVIQFQAFGGGQRLLQPQSEVISRVWGNRTYGQIAASGRYVFAVDGGFDFPTLQQQQMMLFGARGARMPGRLNGKLPEVHNRLVALDLKRQGAVAWVVGGKTGEMNPDLKGVFFLGPPLPDHDRIYTLFEKQGVVGLAALDAQTGATEWMLNIAPILSGVATSLPRRMLGASPSLDDGLLVCPTTVGGLVAIDTVRRQFRWGWAPKQETSQLNNVRRRMMQLTNHAGGWLDRPVLMTKDKVIHTTDADSLYCLDRETGNVLWQRPRQGAWFVGCVAEDVVLLVGRHRFTAFSLADGAPAWTDSPFQAIPAGGVPTGRGFVDGDSYLLPTSEGAPGEPAELLRIHLKTGKPTRIRLKGRLGNLASNGRWIVSTGPDGVELLSENKLEKPVDAVEPAAELDWDKLTGPQLVEFLGSRIFQERQQATAALRKRKTVDVIQLLGDLALGDDPDAAHRAGVILVAMKDNGVKNDELTAILQRAAEAKNGARVAMPDANKLRKRAIAKLMSVGAGVQLDGQHIVLGRWRGKPEDLKLLHTLGTVKQMLFFTQPQVNEMMEHIAGLKTLEMLTFQQCNLTDAGLAKLDKLPKLRHLELRGTAITDASIDKLLQFKSLQMLGIMQTKISKEGRERLVKAFPKGRVTEVK